MYIKNYKQNLKTLLSHFRKLIKIELCATEFPRIPGIKPKENITMSLV